VEQGYRQDEDKDVAVLYIEDKTVRLSVSPVDLYSLPEIVGCVTLTNANIDQQSAICLNPNLAKHWHPLMGDTGESLTHRCAR
jgi:hypothetical protein